MEFADYPRKLLAIAELLHGWAGALVALDSAKREKVACFADEIAATLARAAQSAVNLEADPANRAAARSLVREYGRIAGYLETIVGVLRHHLDGRKLSGVKRRLEQLGPGHPDGSLAPGKARTRIARLFAAEGYFRALADSLRA
jgi:hypothetical protein